MSLSLIVITAKEFARARQTGHRAHVWKMRNIYIFVSKTKGKKLLRRLRLR